MHLKSLPTILLLSTTIVSAASAEVITPSNLDGWSLQNVRGSGTAAITNTYADSGSGSLMMQTTGSGDKADFVDTWGLVGDRTLGSITSLSYDIYRASSSNTADFRAVAFRLSFYDQATQKSGYLIYEPTYQPPGNSPVPTDKFVTVDMTAGNFWMREFSPGQTIEKYDVTLAQWASGTSQAPGAYVLSASTNIYAIEVGVGSGWERTYTGAVDNVNVAFGRDVINSNFAPNAQAVPEPASMVLIGAGLLGLGVVRRKRG